jgi:hypothetical protein
MSNYFPLSRAIIGKVDPESKKSDDTKKKKEETKEECDHSTALAGGCNEVFCPGNY